MTVRIKAGLQLATVMLIVICFLLARAITRDECIPDKRKKHSSNVPPAGRRQWFAFDLWLVCAQAFRLLHDMPGKAGGQCVRAH